MIIIVLNESSYSEKLPYPTPLSALRCVYTLHDSSRQKTPCSSP